MISEAEDLERLLWRFQKKMNKRWIRKIILFVVILLLARLISCFLMQHTTVHGESMQPTLQDGDCLLMDKISYRFRDPKRFDIVVFSYRYKENTYYIKRVIGLPGDTIKISKGVIYVNGKALVEHYGNDSIQEAGLAAGEIVLGDDEYFVLGDNRNSSIDSREPSVGNIKKANIVGRVWMCLTFGERFGVL